MCFRHIRISFSARSGEQATGIDLWELRRAIKVITSYATQLWLAPASMLVRLDGLYGDAAPLFDVLEAGLRVIARSRAYHLLELPVVKQTLVHSPDHMSPSPESGMTRSLYDCSSVPLTPAGPETRLVIATHPGTSSDPAVGVERDGIVYELFVSTLPALAFTASDVLDLYLHRGSFETTLADEDKEKRGIAGAHIPLAARSSPKSSASGHGISDWNWGNSSPQPNCAPPNSLPSMSLKRPPRTSLNLWNHLRLRSHTAHHNGLAPLLRMFSWVCIYTAA